MDLCAIRTWPSPPSSSSAAAGDSPSSRRRNEVRSTWATCAGSCCISDDPPATGHDPSVGYAHRPVTGRAACGRVSRFRGGQGWCCARGGVRRRLRADLGATRRAHRAGPPRRHGPASRAGAAGPPTGAARARRYLDRAPFRPTSRLLFVAEPGPARRDERATAARAGGERVRAGLGREARGREAARRLRALARLAAAVLDAGEFQAAHRDRTRRAPVVRPGRGGPGGRSTGHATTSSTLSSPVPSGCSARRRVACSWPRGWPPPFAEWPALRPGSTRATSGPGWATRGAGTRSRRSPVPSTTCSTGCRTCSTARRTSSPTPPTSCAPRSP